MKTETLREKNKQRGRNINMKVNLMQFIKTLQDYYISSIHLSVVDNVFPVSSLHIQEGNKCIKMAFEPSVKVSIQDTFHQS